MFIKQAERIFKSKNCESVMSRKIKRLVNWSQDGHLHSHHTPGHIIITEIQKNGIQDISLA